MRWIDGSGIWHSKANRLQHGAFGLLSPRLPTITPGAELRGNMITLHDTFNNHLISSHRTILAAVKARRAHLKVLQKANGKNSYLNYVISDCGVPVDGDKIIACEMKLDSKR